ncbi:MAG: cell division protein FtsZ [Acholeplasmatales bacterium]|nr:cell division protein FtsZ [Acholeplasmatales bacterium]
MIFDDLDGLSTAKTKILVIGVGGAGKNAVDHMIQNEVIGVDFYVVNTDAQDLKASKADHKLLIGKTTTHGQGAGANPERGQQAALESEDDIHEMIGEAQMVFIACGMGGGTGTGAAPQIAKIAKSHRCLTIGICTKPFTFEGPARSNNAYLGLEKMREYVDALIVIPNQKLLQMVSPGTSMLDAFKEADNVLRKGVSGIAETITLPGLINLDFEDVRTVMANKGTALLGIGVATGPNRAIEAARNAIHSALLEVTIDGATDALVNISASEALTLVEADKAVDEIRNNSGKDLNIIFGVTINSDLKDELVVTVVATGYEMKAQENGYADIKEQIFRNMGDGQMSFVKKNTNDELFSTTSEGNLDIGYTEEEPEDDFIASQGTIDRQRELFDVDVKESRRLQKEQKRNEKLLRKQEKQERKNGLSGGNQSFPDWLRKDGQ